MSTYRNLDLHKTKAVVADLFRPNPAIYWADFLSSALVAWLSFTAAGLSPLWTPPMLICGLLSSLAFHRAIAFLHECTHLRKAALPGFRLAWDLLIGFPIVVPMITYDGVHKDHHSSRTFGTERDPEYLPFAGQKRLLYVFLFHSLLMPWSLLVRFIFLSPFGLIFPSFHKWLERHASSLAMNLSYKRELDADGIRRLFASEIWILTYWGTAIWIWWRFDGTAKWPILYLLIVTAIACLNAFRALAAHRYESRGTPQSHGDQFADSVDIPSGVFTELCAPVGLRYHATHHLFPGIPYHNLELAYARLLQQVDLESAVRSASEPTVLSSLLSLWSKNGSLTQAENATQDSKNKRKAEVNHSSSRPLPRP